MMPLPLPFVSVFPSPLPFFWRWNCFFPFSPDIFGWCCFQKLSCKHTPLRGKGGRGGVGDKKVFGTSSIVLLLLLSHHKGMSSGAGEEAIYIFFCPHRLSQNFRQNFRQKSAQPPPPLLPLPIKRSEELLVGLLFSCFMDLSFVPPSGLSTYPENCLVIKFFSLPCLKAGIIFSFPFLL